jgi:hypothetical protein
MMTDITEASPRWGGISKKLGFLEMPHFVLMMAGQGFRFAQSLHKLTKSREFAP